MKGEVLITLAWLLAWLLTSHVLAPSDSPVCPYCGETLVQGLETNSLFCLRCRRWQR